MINVTIDNNHGTELGKMRITNVGEKEEGWSTYVVEVAVERIGAVGLHSRSFDFKRLEGNVLALVLAALTTLEEEELVLENGPVDPSDLERRQRGVRFALPSQASNSERNYGPAFRD